MQPLIINGVEFIRNPEVTQYRCNYYGLRDTIHDALASKLGTIEQIQRSVFSQLILRDLWFVLNFILKVPNSNRPFVVEACQEVEDGPDGWTLDLWARRHYKSSVITKARTLQRICAYPEKSTMIASHTRPAAKKFLRSLMYLMESDQLLKDSFPDVLYDNPRNQSEKWSEDDGLIVNRKCKGRSEATLEAWGIKEGMPIGVHFDWILLDDLETKDDVVNPDVIFKVREAVDLCSDLLTEGGSISIIGTPYSHEGVYIPFIKDKKKADGSARYLYRRKPATDNGLRTGKSVLLSQEELDDEFASKGEYAANCQQLINPTPVGSIKLNSTYIKEISPEMIPTNIVKYMTIDPAGDSRNGKGDAWAIWVVGVERSADDMGASNIYLTDGLVSAMSDSEAIEAIVRMYLNGGIIQKVGVEKVALSSVEVHVANALRTRGRYIDTDSGSLEILRPAGRSKQGRIERALEWPLNNSKIHISNKISQAYRDRLKMEMDKFPYWHDDALDALAYLYDMIKGQRFAAYENYKPLVYAEMGII